MDSHSFVYPFSVLGINDILYPTSKSLANESARSIYLVDQNKFSAFYQHTYYSFSTHVSFTPPP